MKYIGFVLLVLSGYVMAEEVYYCSDNDANGFFSKNGVYKPVLAGLQKFKMKLKDNGNIAISDGGGTRLYLCSTLDATAYKNPKSCVHEYHDSYFNFNQDNGRYIRFFGFGYVFNENDSVSTHIGTCTKF